MPGTQAGAYKMWEERRRRYPPNGVRPKAQQPHAQSAGAHEAQEAASKINQLYAQYERAVQSRAKNTQELARLRRSGKALARALEMINPRDLRSVRDRQRYRKLRNEYQAITENIAILERAIDKSSKNKKPGKKR